MKKIGLHGAYSVRNFGDTLILKIVKEWINEHSPMVEVVLPFATCEMESYEITNKPLKEIQIKELDALIFGPGGYFGEPPVSFLRRLRWTFRNYKKHLSWNNQLYANNIPYAIVGVGVGPITNRIMRRKIVKLVQNASYVSVRDDLSKKYLVDWGVSSNKIFVVPDVALTLKPNSVVIKNEKPKVAFHFTNGAAFKKTGTLESFIKFLKHIQLTNDVYLFEDQKGQFYNSRTGSVKNVLLRNNIKLPIIPYKSPNNLITELESMDKIVTSKLHLGIVGYALGKKVLSIPSHSKTIRFYEQIDRQRFCIPLEVVNADLLIEKFEMLDSIDNSTNIQYSNSIKNRTVVFNFLDEI